jgi:hypothetical protein
MSYVGYYVYDITTENVYSEEDFGLITSSSDDVEDYGQISEPYIRESSEDWFYIYIKESFFPFGSIVFDQTKDIAKYFRSLPLVSYGSSGTFNLLSGLSPPDPYSFSPASYISSGIVTISGISPTRKISTYGYYGDDSNPGTSGTITISQQTSPTREKKSNSYVGFGNLSGFADGLSNYTLKYNTSGTISLSETLIESHTKTSVGLGTLSLSGTSLESYSIEIEKNTLLFNFSGESKNRLNTIYVGKVPDKLNLTGTADINFTPNYPVTGLFRFVRHDSDNNYDTCDQEELTCDKQDSSNVSFVSNPVENTVLFEFIGNANTREIATYEYSSSGSYDLYGSYQELKVIRVASGVGTLFAVSSSVEKEVDIYTGSGTLFNVSGAFESYSIQTLESSGIFNVFGSAFTQIQSIYTNVGIGLFTVSGFADTRKISTYIKDGFGNIFLSGELNYPDVIFIPSPDGFGSINILGTSNNSLTKSYLNTFGTLFALSSGLESLSKSTYIGIGTIYSQEIFGTYKLNLFEIPRTYVCII